jgi:thiol-disulfide isomerase/thioredoxin
MRKHHSVCAAIVFACCVTITSKVVVGNGAASPVAQAPPPQQLDSDSWPQPAPIFHATAQDWINTDGKPIDMADLIKQRKTVLVDFWEYTCVNCIRTLPYLKEWNKRYAKDGLVIVGIHTPEFAFARDHGNVAAAVKRLGITWPVLVDSNYNNWNAYHNTFWPRKYFIDYKGEIVEDHSGEGGYAESEARIQELLKQARPELRFPKLMAAVRDSDKPGARCYPVTPELYAGGRGFQEGQLGNIDEFYPDRTVSLPAPQDELVDGRIYLQGRWKTLRESLQHARETDNPTDKILLRYHAIEANAVIKPEGNESFKVYITQDGHPVAKTDRGDDIEYEPTGESYILVDQPRMYQLTKNAKFGSHTLTLASTSPDFGLYSFTFSSCEAP